MATGNADRSASGMVDGPTLRDALFADKDVQPSRSVDDLACEGVFESAEELREFQNWVATERRAGLA